MVRSRRAGDPGGGADDPPRGRRLPERTGRSGPAGSPVSATKS